MDNTDDGKYKVLSVSDIIMKMPAKTPLSPETVHELLAFLKQRDYIRVKYSDLNDYCLTVLPKGRFYVESTKEEKSERKSSRNRFIAASFFGAMIGSIIGSTIVIALFMLLKILQLL